MAASPVPVNHKKYRVLFTFADCGDPDEYLPQFTGRNPRLKSTNVFSCSTFYIFDHEHEIFATLGGSSGVNQICIDVHFDEHWTFQEGGTVSYHDQVFPIQDAILYHSIQIEGNLCYDDILGIQLPTNIFAAPEQLVG